MTSLGQWVAWVILTMGWNAINSADSRAKNSRSWRYNLWTTLASSALHIASLLWIGNLVLAAKASGHSVVGQLAEMRRRTAS